MGWGGNDEISMVQMHKSQFGSTCAFTLHWPCFHIGHLAPDKLLRGVCAVAYQLYDSALGLPWWEISVLWEISELVAHITLTLERRRLPGFLLHSVQNFTLPPCRLISKRQRWSSDSWHFGWWNLDSEGVFDLFLFYIWTPAQHLRIVDTKWNSFADQLILSSSLGFSKQM